MITERAADRGRDLADIAQSVPPTGLILLEDTEGQDVGICTDDSCAAGSA